MSHNFKQFFLMILVVAMTGFLFIYSEYRRAAEEPPQIVRAAGSNEFGVAGYVSSRSRSSDKNTAVGKITDVGFGWDREEITYNDDISFVPYDAAYAKLNSAGLKILGLLTYPGPDRSHAQWKSYVDEVTSRYPGIDAWEIMNEADNYLSAADYTPYLKEAYDIIRGKSSAPVILTGLTARWEMYPFYDGVAAAGGWGSFDAVGLHMFHDGSPYEDSYNNGTLPQEVQKVINAINKNGGGKNIWVTELGYNVDLYGEENQSNWLVESLKIVHGYSEVEKIFVYRLYDGDGSFGLTTYGFADRPSYAAVKNALANGFDSPAPPVEPEPVAVAAPEPEPEPEPESEPATSSSSEKTTTKIPVDKDKSYLRLDGEYIAADGKDQFKIVVGVEDADGKFLTDRKPSIALSGGQTNLTDFVLIGNEWVTYVSSSEKGERTAEIKVDNISLGSVKMVFGLERPASQAKTISTTPSVVAQEPDKKNNSYLVWLISGIISAIVLVTVLTIFLRKKA